MKKSGTLVFTFTFILILSSYLVAQSSGDYRTRGSGKWSSAQIWEKYNGSTWGNTGSPPTGAETITVQSTDSVYVNIQVSISDTLIQQGIVEPMDSLTITVADGGTYKYDRDAGTIPKCIWAEGSTALITGVTGTAPSDRDQDYYNLTFNTPDLLSNLNMNLNNNTIRGDIHVISTGLARWYLTSTDALDTAIVTIMGDVIVDDGIFSVQGTSNAQTTFIVNHYGNINVTGGNFSISRGSQGNGTTTWYLYEGDFFMSNATTQNSTATPDGAKFIFAKKGVQKLSLIDMQDLKALPIEISNGTTLDMDSTVLAGSGNFHLKSGGTLFTALAGGVNEALAGITGTDTLETGSGYGFNGTEAQVTGTMMPDTIAGLTINNASGVTLSQETLIDGLLDLVSGVFDNTIPFTLGPNGWIRYEDGSLVVPVVSSVEKKDAALIPKKFYVNQNYPNPFNPTTTIHFGLPAASDVTAKVFNLLGQEVATLFKGRMKAGEHQLLFDASKLTSGIYFYRIEAGNSVSMKRMVLIK